jgi:hypothetical protein
VTASPDVVNPVPTIDDSGAGGPAVSGDPSAKPTAPVGAGPISGGDGGSVPVAGSGVLAGPVVPIGISLTLLAGFMGLLFAIARRRSRRGPDGNGLILLPSGPAPDGLDFVAVSTDPDDEPDPVLPEEANMPRWRRPSLRAARFAEPARRPATTAITAFEALPVTFAPIEPNEPVAPMIAPEPPPPPVPKRPRRAKASSPPAQPRPRRRSRSITSPESA